MQLFANIRENRLLAFLLFLFVALAVGFCYVAGCDNPEWIVNRLGLSQAGLPKYEALKFLGIVLGGVLIAIQAVIANKRANAMQQTAQAQADAAIAQAKATEEHAKANQHTEQGQRQERLKNAIEHLGHESDSVRMGGAYELFHLARDTRDRDAKELRQTVLDILCAHIRRTTRERCYRKEYYSKPSVEVQSLLTLLFVQGHNVFRELRINLRESWLNGAGLPKARLEKAALTGVYLQGAYLREAQLLEADLREAHLQRVNFGGAQLPGVVLHAAFLQGAHLEDACLRGAYLVRAHLQGANLGSAQLQAADLGRARLQGAYLGEAHLQGTYLYEAQLQGVCLELTHFQGAEFSGADLRGAISRLVEYSGTFAEHMKRLVGRGSDVTGATFEGGLEPQDVNALVKGMTEEKAEGLRERLTSHIDRPPSHLLTMRRGAVTGAFTEEEADKWIAEYEEGMTEVPGAD